MKPGTHLGPYEIVSRIGAGGMGEVYRARDTRLGRDVAIKVLPARFADDPDRLYRFEQEARATAALNHPSILSIHDVGTYEGSPYLVEELLEGESLREHVTPAALAVHEALGIGTRIAAGLAAAHARGIIHRDLKPENVFITKDGAVKVLDFGLAKLVAAPEGTDLSALPTGSVAYAVVGTAGYMAPEQVRGLPVDERADIFALGCVLYEMLAGRRAFLGETPADTMSAILREEPTDLAAAREGLPPELVRIVRHCLEKQPERRFQSMRDLAFDLEAHCDASPPQGPSASGAAGRGRRRTLPLVVAAVVGLTAAVAYIGWRGGGTGVPQGVVYRQLTLRRQTIFGARFAPDGNSVVFSAAPHGTAPELFTVRADFPDPKPLGFQDIQLLSVSPKGELAVLTGARYIANNVFRGTLARMPLDGGAPREVLENVRDADFSPDGGALAVIREVAGKDRLEFPIGKALCETGGYLSNPRFSPRGDRIAFLEHPSRWDDQGDVAVVDLSGRKTVLSPTYWGVEGLAWTPGGDEVLFSEGESYPEFAVHAVTVAGASRTALGSAGGLTIRDAPRKGRWLVTRDEVQLELQVLAPGQTAERNLEWLDSSNFPILSPDGRTVVFTEQSGGVGPNYAVCLRGTDGSPVVRLGDGTAQDLSRDGKSVLVVAAGTPQHLVVYPTGAGEARRLENGGIQVYETARFFPDGGSVLACGHEEGHATRCYAQAIAGGEPRPVTPEGTWEGIVSPDGRRILVSSSTGGFTLYPAEGGEGTAVPGIEPSEKKICWSPDGRTVLVYRSDEIPCRVERVDLATGRRELVRTIQPVDPSGVVQINFPSFSSDEKSYVYVCERATSRLYLAEGAR